MIAPRLPGHGRGAGRAGRGRLAGLGGGDTAPRGERGTLIVSLDSLLRMPSNPFFPFRMERIDRAIDQPAPR